MYMFIIKYCIISLYILVISIPASNCFTAKHNKYKKYTIEDDKLCSVVAKRKVELKREREDGVIVTQTTTRDHALDWHKDLYCKFEVQSDTGLFVVVQNMNFRKNTSTDECIDYVKFNTRQDNLNKKLCGNFNVAQEYTEFANTIDKYGYIETAIFISKESWKLADKMDLKIVYTRYKRCNSMYSPCMAQNFKECIHNELFNDSLVNCPIDDCYDENGCQSLRQRLNLESCGTDNNCITHISSQSGQNSTKVILSAVTSLVVSFVVFIICIWVCKKTGKVCWGINCSDTSRTRQPSRVIEMQNRTETNAQPVQPEVPTAPDPEKDLPPSYESLFPS